MTLFTRNRQPRHQHSMRNLLLLQAFLVFTVIFSCINGVTGMHLDGAPIVGMDEVDFDGVGASVDHYQHRIGRSHFHHNARRRSQRDLISSNNNNDVHEECDAVKGYFDTIDVQLNDNFKEKGAICGGSCCSNSTEASLRQKATIDFERLLHFNTKSLRGILESTANVFRDHALDLVDQSENKTLVVFSQVYRRMIPASTKLIHELYAEIRSQLKSTRRESSNTSSSTGSYATSGINNLNSLDEAIQQFFVNLFPIAYHQAVNLKNNNHGDLHEDYISCLKHTFDDLQPFGSIPKDLKKTMTLSVQTAQIFMDSLQQSADVLSETEELYGMNITEACQRQLLKMSYCPNCNGHKKGQVKTCYSYCMNVMRGCSVQYVGILDNPWSKVVDAIDNLVQSHIRSDHGITGTIKLLDTRLSEAIMQAMQNGPDLEKKVKKTCGTPKLLATPSNRKEMRPPSYPNGKWATPPTDAEILRFLSTLEKSKEFYSNIVNNVCEDDDIQRNDHHCWTGDRIGDYTQLVMDTVVTAQRYNPEVPLEMTSQSTILNELVDKLIKIHKNIGSAVPSTTRSYSDIQSDMARHDEEGSGRISDDIDDEEYGSIHGSGDGSGDSPPDSTSLPYDPVRPVPIDNNDIQERSGAALPSISYLVCLSLSFFSITLVTLYLASSSSTPKL